MAIPVPMTFVSGDQASADYISGIHDPLAWLMVGGPICVARIDTPISLTSLTFTPITFDITVHDSGGFMSAGTPIAPEDSLYIIGSSVRCSSARGNKELRVSWNSQFADGDPWIATTNQFGVATAAISSLAASGLYLLTAGDSIDAAIYTDTPTAVTADNGVIWAAWIRGV